MNVIRRRITGIVLAAIWLFVWAFQGWPLRVCLVLVMALGVVEVCQAFEPGKVRRYAIGGGIFSLLALPVYELARRHYGPFAAMGPILMLAMLCTMVALALLVLRGPMDMKALVASVFPIFYPGLMFTTTFPLMDFSDRAMATLALGQAFMIALANDLFAYEVGSLIGKRKLAPLVSPKKTVEGSVAGLVGGMLFSCGLPYLVRLVWPEMALHPLWLYAILGILASIAAQLGDLAASYVKRVCGIKDFGSILPGHGGIMDRFDAILFSAVVCNAFYFLMG